ncbi:MAG: Teichoic acid export ATP-binding protein TagH [Nitrospira sp.]|jgi:lipopolysaccharide transport system ATP-binding protein|nr:Teichoic acid export ATP-binding protein TagH [Nitrospira sp.]
MHTRTAIAVRNVSKKFKLFNSPKDRLLEALHPLRKQYHHEFWALRDVSFELNQGETIGIVGKNGSGKSTLLQIICGVMLPTSGHVQANGRIAAMLELGAGFNPEFTGRDNAILNGATMGISRKEMLKKLPYIEDFADIGEFFDRPVKIYSSGMYARLAFACSINVDPDILIVDEALSVGDAKFQNKCYMHFKRFQAEGKTIILVSHSTDAILRQCTRALLIDGGRVITEGEPQFVIDRYYQLLFPSNRGNECVDFRPESMGGRRDFACLQGNGLPTLLPGGVSHMAGTCEDRNSYNKDEFRFGDREAEIVDYVLLCEGRLFPIEIPSGAKVGLYVCLKSNNFDGQLSAGFAIKTVDAVKLFGANTISSGIRISMKPREMLWIRFDFFMNIGPGDVFIDLGCGDWTEPPARPLDRRHSVIHLVVTANGRFDGLSNCFVDISVMSQSPAAGFEAVPSIAAE